MTLLSLDHTLVTVSYRGERSQATVYSLPLSNYVPSLGSVTSLTGSHHALATVADIITELLFLSLCGLLLTVAIGCQNPKSNTQGARVDLCDIHPASPFPQSLGF